MDKMERLVVASDGDQRHMILQFEGDHLSLLADELAYTPQEMELVPPGYGFWSWEGTIRLVAREGEDGEYNVFPLGTWRTLTDTEWEAVSALELYDDD